MLNVLPMEATAPRLTLFRDVLWEVARRNNAFPEEEGLGRGMAGQMAGAINSCYRYCYQFYDWPESVRIDKVVLHAHPVTGTPWMPRTFALNYLNYGRIFGIYGAHPLADENAKLVSYRHGPDGIYLDTEDPVWVHYRPDLSKFTAEEWDETRSYPPYPADSRVYYPEDGNCYRWRYNTSTTAGEAPDGFYWEVIPFLTILFEAVVAGAHAMTKTTEGQAGTSTKIEQMMVEHLEQELMQMTVQEGQAKFLRVA